MRLYLMSAREFAHQAQVPGDSPSSVSIFSSSKAPEPFHRHPFPPLSLVGGIVLASTQVWSQCDRTKKKKLLQDGKLRDGEERMLLSMAHDVSECGPGYARSSYESSMWPNNGNGPSMHSITKGYATWLGCSPYAGRLVRSRDGRFCFSASMELSGHSCFFGRWDMPNWSPSTMYSSASDRSWPRCCVSGASGVRGTAPLCSWGWVCSPSRSVRASGAITN